MPYAAPCSRPTQATAPRIARAWMDLSNALRPCCCLLECLNRLCRRGADSPHSRHAADDQQVADANSHDRDDERREPWLDAELCEPDDDGGEQHKKSRMCHRSAGGRDGRVRHGFLGFCGQFGGRELDFLSHEHARLARQVREQLTKRPWVLNRHYGLSVCVVVRRERLLRPPVSGALASVSAVSVPVVASAFTLDPLREGDDPYSC